MTILLRLTQLWTKACSAIARNARPSKQHWNRSKISTINAAARCSLLSTALHVERKMGNKKLVQPISDLWLSRYVLCWSVFVRIDLLNTTLQRYAFYRDGLYPNIPTNYSFIYDDEWWFTKYDRCSTYEFKALNNVDLFIMRIHFNWHTLLIWINIKNNNKNYSESFRTKFWFRNAHEWVSTSIGEAVLPTPQNRREHSHQLELGIGSLRWVLLHVALYRCAPLNLRPRSVIQRNFYWCSMQHEPIDWITNR